MFVFQQLYTFFKAALSKKTPMLKIPILIKLLISFGFNQTPILLNKYLRVGFNESVFYWTFCQLLRLRKTLGRIFSHVRPS